MQFISLLIASQAFIASTAAALRPSTVDARNDKVGSEIPSCGPRGVTYGSQESSCMFSNPLVSHTLSVLTCFFIEEVPNENEKVSSIDQ